MPSPQPSPASPHEAVAPCWRGGFVSLALLCALASCAQPSTPQAQCARQASEAPEVRDMEAKSAGSEVYYKEHQYELRDARHRAELACLRARGLAPAGGVEAPQRRNSLFNGLGL